MGWYDWFSGFYDRSLEKLYRDARVAAVEALALPAGAAMRVLDLPCGTGQSFDGLAAALGPAGRVIGADLSRGMIGRAGRRCTRLGLTNVETVHADVHALTAEAIGGPVDRLHVFLGMSTFPDPDAAFERLWGLLRPGGRAVIVDVFTDRITFQGRMVNLVARADIRRRSWEPLEKRAVNFGRNDLPSLEQHGGTLFLAVGDKPAS